MKRLTTLSALLLLVSVAGTARAADPKAAPAKPAPPPAAAKPATPPAAQPAAPAPAGPPSPGANWSLEEKAGYIIGLNLGNNLRTQEIPVTADQIIKGLRDGLGNAKAQLADTEIQATMTEFQQQMMARQQAKTEKNKKAGEDFLAANKAKPGVKTTASGLQYEVIKEGTGPTPKATDKVTVNYKGSLLDGKVFDSSYDRGQPVTFGVGQVIPGWVEGLQLMKVGSKYKLTIPSALGYGENGAGNTIPPNSVLQFEVELLKIEPPDATPPAPAADAKKPAEGQKPPQ